MRVDVALRQARVAGLDRADAELLLAAVLERPRTFLLAWPEHLLSMDQQQRMQSWVAARASGVPVAYLLGRQAFFGLELAVSNAVLVPRPETELLVEHALGQGQPEAALRVLDLGTGSGAIALAIAHARPGWEVHAVDRSSAALDIARANARRLGVRVQFHLGDWLAALPAGLHFHGVLSNPPYLAADDPHLPSLRHEPAGALVAGSDALADLHTLVDTVPQVLHAGGWLALEHGWNQSPAVCAALRARGYTEVGHTLDLAGHPRISHGRWAGNSGASRRTQADPVEGVG